MRWWLPDPDRAAVIRAQVNINEEFRMIMSSIPDTTMTQRFIPVFFFALFLLAGSAFSQHVQSAEPRAPESWERDEAWRASASVDTKNVRLQLHELLAAGDSHGTLLLIRAIDQRADWPTPARERVLLDFVNGLRKETPRAIGAQVMEYLGRYPSRVLVAHEDHPQASVPLFNIRAATAGVLNTWTRLESSYQGAVLLASGAGNLVRAYLEQESLPARLGLIDALSTASPAQLEELTQHALSIFEQQPRLLALAGRAALIAKDLDALETLVEKGRGADMPGLLRGSAQMLDAQQSSRLLQAALRNPSHETAALAIAQLTPALAGHQATERLLLQMLENPDLGASAALALVKNPSTTALQELEVLAAADEHSLRSSRARLALGIYASRLSQAQQP